MEDKSTNTVEPQQGAPNESHDDDMNSWFDASPDAINVNTAQNQSIQDVDGQYELVPSTLTDQLTSESIIDTTPLVESQLYDDNSTQTDVDSFMIDEIQKLKQRIQDIIFPHSAIITSTTENAFENLDQISLFINKLQDDIKEVKR